MNELVLEKALILWDVDGTLVEMGRGREDKHHRAIELICERSISKRTRRGGQTDLEIISELVHVNDIDPGVIPSALDLLDKLTNDELDRKPLLATPNAKSTLDEFAKRGYINGVLTGNTQARAIAKLKSAGLVKHLSRKYFFNGQLAQDRHQLGKYVSETLSRLGVNDVLVVGDTPLDIQASRSAGYSCVAVATGSFSSNDLATYDPDFLIPDLFVGFDDLLHYIETRFKSNC